MVMLSIGVRAGVVFECLKNMPRNPRILQPEYPYHVTLRSHNKLHFAIPSHRLWSLMCDLLLFCTYAFKIEIHSFVLMANHYHMILRTPESNLDKFTKYFHLELSRELSRLTGDINQKFGARYYSTIIQDLNYYSHAYKYVYRNPVEAGLCLKVQDYEFTSLAFLLNRQSYRFPVFDTYFDSVESIQPSLDWLNLSYQQDHYYQVKQALREQFFTPRV